MVSVAYSGAARGRWVPRAYAPGETSRPAWGERTGDLHIKKKWLGYRRATRGDGRRLTLAEVQCFRGMGQRLAALLTLQDELDQAYRAAATNAFTAEELGVRR